MNLSLELGPEFQRTLASMSAISRNLPAATKRGLGLACQYGANQVVENELMGQSLNPRTRNLSRAVQSWKESDYAGVIGVREGSAVDAYKYLLGGGPELTIYPKKGNYLAIPVLDALTGSGTLKDEYSGGLRAIVGGRFIRINDRLFFVKRSGKTDRSRFLILFRMVRSVRVYPTDALATGTLNAADGMTDILQGEISKELNN
jgi:hypothetical protein